MEKSKLEKELAGLINSDGWCGVVQKKYRTITFVNTVFSIVSSLINCLDYNNINYRKYNYDGVIDKRTLKKNKRLWRVMIMNQNDIDKLQEKLSYSIKEFKYG